MNDPEVSPENNLEPQQVHDAYAAKHKRHVLSMLPLLAAIISLFILAAMPELVVSLGNYIDLVKVAIGAMVALYIIISLIDWRCPQCNSLFGKRFNPKFCDKCGVQLRDS